MTFGLACDRDGYDLRIRQCSVCLSRGCADKDRCRPVRLAPVATVPNWAADEHWRLLPEYQRRIDAQRTPNRLKGAYINEHGEAV